MELKKISIMIDSILHKIYSNESKLFIVNDGIGIAERCLVFRFAFYLQRYFAKYNYYVDCDYNSSLRLVDNGKGGFEWADKSGKPIKYRDKYGNRKYKNRFIDIIVHKRIARETDLICFEIKKWNNKTKNGMDKDVNNLKILTSEYGYKYGFHLIFGRTRNKCKIDVYANGRLISNAINE